MISARRRHILLGRQPWTPLALGPTAYANPDQPLYQDTGTSTPATADGDPVGNEPDQSGHGYNATGTTTARPLLKLATQNGRNTLLYNGTANFLATPSITHGVGTGGFWWVIAAKVGASATYRTMMHIGGGAPGFYQHSLKLNLFWNTDHVFDTTLVAGTFHLFEVLRAGTTIKAYIDGVQEATTFTFSNSMAAGVMQYGSDNGSADFFNSNIGQQLFYAFAPSAAQRTQLINYLGTYYGVSVTP